MHSAWFLVLCLAVFFPTIAAQDDGSIGQCSGEVVSDFVASLPNGAICGPAALGVLFPADLTELEYSIALTTFCTADCGGAIARFSSVNCGSPETGITFLLYCLPRETGDDRCRSTLPDLPVEEPLIADLAQCNSFTTECPEGCADALEAIVDQFGCCYQTVYNDSELLTFFEAVDLITADELGTLRIVSKSALWGTCNVSLTAPCVGEPFPGDSQLVIGSCTESDFAPLADSISPSCAAAITTVFTNPTEQSTRDFCQRSCVSKYSQFAQTCQDAFTANLSQVICFETEGQIGSSCAFALNPGVTFINAGVCFGTPTSEGCPSGCQNALVGITEQLGCCYQDIYNDTVSLDVFYIDGHISFEERVFFDALRNSELWERCDVPLQPKCVLGGSLQLTASTIMMLCAFTLNFFL